MSIKYYRLAKDEEPPEEFCAVRDVGGEPSEYVFYVPEAENAKLRDENSMLRKYASKALSAISYCDCCPYVDCGCDTETVPMHEGCKAFEELSELGVEVE